MQPADTSKFSIQNNLDMMATKCSQPEALRQTLQSAMAASKQPSSGSMLDSGSEVVSLRYDGSVYMGQVIKHGYGTQVDKFGNKYEG